MTYVPLVGIPGLYALSISLAALIAVVKIVIAGAKYMLDPLVSGKSEAKSDITNALIGLLIIIGAVVLLNTVNSDLTNLQITAKPAVVDNTPIPGTISAKDYCDQLNKEGKPCAGEWCSTLLANYGYYINPGDVDNPSCPYICERIPGYLAEDGWADTDVTFLYGTEAENCQYSEDLLQENLDNYLRSLVNYENCPGGAGSDFAKCKASFCSDGGSDINKYTEVTSGLYGCKLQCEDLRNGTYIENSGACVYVSDVILSENECLDGTIWDEESSICKNINTETVVSIECYSSGDGLNRDCTLAGFDCEDLGGVGVPNEDNTTLTCTIPAENN
jgi:hypothetical protein